MEIKELRLQTGMSQPKFADLFGIPLGTLRNWEQGIATPPSYVSEMIKNRIWRTEMINVPTLKMVSILNDLAEKSKEGIIPFSKIKEINGNPVLYDDVESDAIGFKVVLDKVVEEEHADITSYYDNYPGFEREFLIRVSEQGVDEGEPFILVSFPDNSSEIVIEDGKWYFSS